MREARRFFDELPAGAGRAETVVFNKQLPASWTEKAVLRGTDVAPTARTALRDNLAGWAGEVRRQHDVKQAFAARHSLELINVPWAHEPPTSVESLARLLASAPPLQAHLPAAT
jgi:hypothetical protein